MTNKPGISFACPSCGKAYRVPLAMAGRGANCKACGEKMRVPKAPSPPAPKPAPPAKPDDGFMRLKEDDDEVKPRSQPQKPRPKPKPSAPDSRPKAQGPKPTQRSGGSSPTQRTSSGKRPSDKPPAKKKEPEVLSMAELDFVEDESDELIIPLSQPVQELEPTQIVFEPVQSGRKKRKRGRGAAGGSIGDRIQAGFQGMIDALLQRGAAGQNVPITQKVSMGGSFLVVGGVLLMIFGLISSGADAVTSRSSGPVHEDAQTGFLLFGLGSLLLGALTVGRRVWSPRPEPESILVLVVFWATLGMALIASLAGLFGGAGIAKLIAIVGIIGIVFAAAAFGVWLIVRVASDGGGTALIFIPAIVMPITAMIEMMTNLPEGAEINFGAVLVALVINFIIFSLMGGALAFLSLIGIAAMIAGFIDSDQLPQTLQGNVTMIVTGLCLLCYFFLVLAKWRVMIKPVAWQFVILSVGLLLMVSVIGYAVQFE